MESTLIISLIERDIQELTELESKSAVIEHIREKYMIDDNDIISAVKLSDNQLILTLNKHNEKD